MDKNIKINEIDIDILLKSYELLVRLYKNGPLIDKKESLNIWYDAQRLMILSEPKLVEAKKDDFNKKITYNCELLKLCLSYSSNGQINGISDDYWYETAKNCEKEIDNILSI